MHFDGESSEIINLLVYQCTKYKYYFRENYNHYYNNNYFLLLLLLLLIESEALNN